MGDTPCQAVTLTPGSTGWLGIYGYGQSDIAKAEQMDLGGAGW